MIFNRIILVGLLCHFSQLINGENKMTFDPRTGKYEKMLIFINDNVPEGDGTLLSNIQKYFKQASKSLYEASKQLNNGQKYPVQFGKIYISVPQTWNVAQANQITWQQCNKADWFVSLPGDNNNLRMEPYTKQLGECGQPAEFTRFSNDFFNTNRSTLEQGKIIMNEFAKLRYGVFSEKPYQNTLTNFNGFEFVNSTCGANIKWKINRPAPLCSEKNAECQYYIIGGQQHNHSVMFDTSTDSAKFFCDDSDEHQHNKFAHTLQNIKCKQKSVGSIIHNHSDFASLSINSLYHEPQFEIVKSTYRKIVLVLDTSSSMGPIIETMKSAVISFLQDVVENTAHVGLVNFDSVAVICNYAQPIASYKSQIINNVQGLRSSGWTNIPDGLDKGVQVLGGNIRDNEPVRGTIILLSDGGNNRQHADYSFFIDQIIKKGIVVNSISYGTAADPQLSKLTTGTLGQFLFAQTNNIMELKKTLITRHSCEVIIDQVTRILQTETQIKLSSESVIENNLVYIDKYAGNNLIFDISFPMTVRNYQITVLGPNGTEYRSIKSVNEAVKFILTFKIDSTNVAGQYKIRIKRPGTYRQARSADTRDQEFKIGLTVTSEPPKGRKIIPTGELSSSKIDLLIPTSSVKSTVDLTTCGITPHENVTVQLMVVTPNKNELIFNMTDDGTGDDSIAGDGIYTKDVFAKYLMNTGFYQFGANISILDTKAPLEKPTLRTVDLGSLRIMKIASNIKEDKIVPAMISNIKVELIDDESNSLRIIFPAVGNDGLEGTINEYKVIVKDVNKTIVRLINATKPAGEKIVVELNFSSDNISNPFTIKLQGVDNVKNHGMLSNPINFNWKIKEIYKKQMGNKSKSLYSHIFSSLIIFLSIYWTADKIFELDFFIGRFYI